MKKAFSIIEIVFLIVIIGISIPIIPVIINLSNQSIENLLKSSDIDKSYTKLMFSAKKLWDENNNNDVNISGNYYVLRTNEITNNLECVVGTNYRLGHFETINRRKCNIDDTVTATLSTALGLDGTETPLNQNDIDDFNNQLTYIVSNNGWISSINVDKHILPSTGSINLYINSTEDLGVFADNALSIKVQIGNTIETLYNVSATSNEKTIHFSKPISVSMDGETLKLIDNELSGNITNVSGNELNKNYLLKNEIISEVEYISYTYNAVSKVIDATVTSSATTTNIKRLKVTLKNLQLSDEEEDDTFSFYYFATNIGTDIPLVRVNQ